MVNLLGLCWRLKTAVGPHRDRCKLMQLRFLTQLRGRAVSESKGIESIEIVGGMLAWCEEGTVPRLRIRVSPESSEFVCEPRHPGASRDGSERD